MRADKTNIPASLVTWVIVILMVFPLIWMVLTSIKPQSELFVYPIRLLPEHVTFEHYRRLLEDTPFISYFWNSIVLSAATTVVVMAVATIGGYSLARFAYRGREAIATAVLCTYLMPSVVLIIPLYLMMVKLGLQNTLTSLVISYTTFALPYAMWLLRSFMAGIPDDLEAAALVDGASRLGAFVDVILPQHRRARPLTTGVMNMLVSSFNIEWSLLMAASVMMSVPLLFFFAFLQRYLTSGFGAGGVKG